MTQDYFGYAKEVYGPGNVATTPMTLVSISGGERGNIDIRLAQSVTLNYQRTATPTFELGSDNVWFVAGGAQGDLTIDRIVGRKGSEEGHGLLRPYTPQGACKEQTIIIGSGDGNCGLKAGGVEAKGLLTKVGVQLQVNQMTVQDNAQFAIGSVVVKD